MNSTTQLSDTFQSELDEILKLKSCMLINNIDWIHSESLEILKFSDKLSWHFDMENKLIPLRKHFVSKDDFLFIETLDNERITSAFAIDSQTWQVFTGKPLIENLDMENGEKTSANLGMISDFCLLKNFLCVLKKQKSNYIENFYENNHRLQALINRANPDNFLKILQRILKSSSGNRHTSDFIKYFIHHTTNQATLNQMNVVALGNKLKEIQNRLADIESLNIQSSENIDTSEQISAYRERTKIHHQQKLTPFEEMSEDPTSIYFIHNMADQSELLSSLKKSVQPIDMTNRRADAESLFTSLTQIHYTQIQNILQNTNNMKKRKQPDTTTAVLPELQSNPYQYYSAQQISHQVEQDIIHTSNHNNQEIEDTTASENILADEEITQNSLEEFTEWLIQQPNFHNKK